MLFVKNFVPILINYTRHNLAQNITHLYLVYKSTQLCTLEAN